MNKQIFTASGALNEAEKAVLNAALDAFCRDWDRLSTFGHNLPFEEPHEACSESGGWLGKELVRRCKLDNADGLNTPSRRVLELGKSRDLVAGFNSLYHRAAGAIMWKRAMTFPEVKANARGCVCNAYLKAAGAPVLQIDRGSIPDVIRVSSNALPMAGLAAYILAYGIHSTMDERREFESMMLSSMKNLAMRREVEEQMKKMSEEVKNNG